MKVATLPPSPPKQRPPPPVERNEGHYFPGFTLYSSSAVLQIRNLAPLSLSQIPMISKNLPFSLRVVDQWGSIVTVERARSTRKEKNTTYVNSECPNQHHFKAHVCSTDQDFTLGVLFTDDLQFLQQNMTLIRPAKEKNDAFLWLTFCLSSVTFVWSSL